MCLHILIYILHVDALFFVAFVEKFDSKIF